MTFLQQLEATAGPPRRVQLAATSYQLAPIDRPQSNFCKTRRKFYGRRIEALVRTLSRSHD